MAIIIKKARLVWRNPYITDGLIAMWDGEWNTGGGKHSNSASSICDLSGNNHALSLSNASYSIGGNYVAFTSGFGMASLNSLVKTVSVCYTDFAVQERNSFFVSPTTVPVIYSSKGALLQS